MAVLLKRKPVEEQIPPEVPEVIESKGFGVPFADKMVNLTQGELLIMLSSLGLSRQEIAEVIGTKAKYIDDILAENPDLQDAVKEARKKADIQVVNALFKRALGYNYCEVLYDNYGKIYRKMYKHLPPDVTACIFWLKNRMKDEWADSFKGELTLRDRMDLGSRQLSSKQTTK